MADDEVAKKVGVTAKVGLTAAIKELMASSVESMQHEQLSLLPTPAAVEMAGADDETAARSGPGRPPGSKNKSTEDWTHFILKSHRSPLLFLAEAYNRPAVQLAAELKCDVLDAFKIQVIAAKELAPYMHSKQPVAINLESKGEVSLTLTVSPSMASMVQANAGDGARVIDAEVIEPGEIENVDKSTG